MYAMSSTSKYFSVSFTKVVKCHQAGLNVLKDINFLSKLEVQSSTKSLAGKHGQLC